MDRNGAEPCLLEAKSIVKAFPGVLALDGVDFDVRPGEVHALVGENGAGKSTLMHILSGSMGPDAGQIRVKGEARRFPSPREAARAGVSIIHQELSLVPDLSVAENIFLGRTPLTALCTIAWKKLYAQTAALLARLDLPIDPRSSMGSHAMGVQQMVEIAKALSLDASCIIMDEPTSSLSVSETDRLFQVIEQLRSEGKGIVYITHRMEEIYRIADRITVLRDGRFVGSRAAKALSREEMIHWMVGREVDSFYVRNVQPPGEVALAVEGLFLPRRGGLAPRVDRVSLEVRAGEILGLAGLRGSGNSELLGSLFGRYGSRPAGPIRVKGQEARIRHPLDAIRHGLALLTNDRKESGLVMPLSVAQNIALPSLKKAAPLGWLTRQQERSLAKPFRESLDIRVPSLDSEVWTLSGGNQQKVILAKWLLTDPSVILMDEPTRGIDVAAKAEIYRLMDEWTAQGKAMVLITSELPELLAMSDRILVMRQGRVSAHFTREEATPEKVMAAAV